MLSETQTNWLAACVLAALGLWLLVWLVALARRTRYTLAQIPFYYPFNLVMARVLWRAKVSGRLAVGPDQGAVIVCNHIGPIDPAFIALASDRIVHWMVAREYCSHPAMAWFFRIMKAIPVNRGGVDTAATKLAIRYAQQGGLVGLFPEGRINTTDKLLLPGRPGAALIAVKARVPVIPCFLAGSPYDGTSFGCLFMSARARLVIGKPIDISSYYDREGDKEVLEDLTKLFLVEIARLAGVEDYPAEVAGRNWKTGAEPVAVFGNGR
jgi:1-acyl-sn-glycerol-3-phosphate acyltransferase